MDAADHADKWYEFAEYDSEPDDFCKLCAGCHKTYVSANDVYCDDCYEARFWPLPELDDSDRTEGDDDTCPLQ